MRNKLVVGMNSFIVFIIIMVVNAHYGRISRGAAISSLVGYTRIPDTNPFSTDFPYQSVNSFMGYGSRPKPWLMDQFAL
jgi:hypothetical protein